MVGSNERQLAELLRRHGLRVTVPRMAVARCLARAGGHLSAGAVRDRLRADGCRCARATIYNVLNDFARRGIVQPLHIDGGCTYFEPAPKPHPHLYRRDTGELIDLPADALPDRQALGLPPELEVESISLVVHARPRAGRA